MPELTIKLYGERNTGTNYVSELLRLNLDVDQVPGVVPRWVRGLQRLVPGREAVKDVFFRATFAHNLGWKHALVKPVAKLRRYPICSDNLLFVTVTKNPYSWLLSLHNRPYHQYWQEPPDFESFVVRPWRTVGRDNGPGEFKSPVELWNRKNASYLGLGAEFPVVHLRFEGLLEDPESVVRRVAEASSCAWKREGFENYERSTKDSDRHWNYYREYYLQERWRDKLSACAITAINEQLDDAVLDFFGYRKLGGASAADTAAS